MSAVQDESSDPTAPPGGVDGPRARRRRGVVLLLGALLIALLVDPVGPLDLTWNPLLVGLAFVAAAAVTGPHSPLWGAGLVVSAWGTAVVLENTVRVDGTGGLTTAAIGLGGLLAAYLGSRGWGVDAASVAWPVVFLGLGLLVSSNAGSGTVTGYTAGLAAVYGLVELVGARRAAA